MRVAVEAGWVRARNTCLAADAVSLLAAVVLYIFAAGVVKGFAFALGLSTLIDLVVFFWFTQPMVSYLARYPFFNKGHALSGLSRDTLGLDRPPGRRERLMGNFSRLGNELYSGERSIDFVGRRWLWYAISALIVLVGRPGPVVQGPQHGHRVHRRRGVPRHAARRPGHPGHRRRAARRRSPAPASTTPPPRSSPPRAPRRSSSRPSPLDDAESARRSSPRSSTPPAPSARTSPRPRSAPAGARRSRSARCSAWRSSSCWSSSSSGPTSASGRCRSPRSSPWPTTSLITVGIYALSGLRGLARRP